MWPNIDMSSAKQQRLAERDVLNFGVSVELWALIGSQFLTTWSSTFLVLLFNLPREKSDSGKSGTSYLTDRGSQQNFSSPPGIDMASI